MRDRWPIVAVFVGLGIAYLGYPYATLYRLDTALRQSDAPALRSLVDWYAVREGVKEDICDMVLDEPTSPRQSNELAPFGAGFVRGMAGNAVDRIVTPERLVSLIQGASGFASASSSETRQGAGPVGVSGNPRVGSRVIAADMQPRTHPVVASRSSNDSDGHPDTWVSNVGSDVRTEIGANAGSKPEDAPGTAAEFWSHPRLDATIDAHVEWAFFQSPTAFVVLVRTSVTADPIRVEMALREWRWRVRRVTLPLALLRRASSGT